MQAGISVSQAQCWHMLKKIATALHFALDNLSNWFHIWLKQPFYAQDWHYALNSNVTSSLKVNNKITVFQMFLIILKPGSMEKKKACA